MNLIVAVDGNWAIGNNGDLLCKNPIDMKFFKETTTGKVVIMGRKTLESFPKQKPLPNRTNIVLSRNNKIDGCIVVNSIDELLIKVKNYDDDDLFVIGGGQIYKELLPYCKKAYVTKMKNIFEADTYFPNLDELDSWEIVDKSEDLKYENIEFNFFIYENKK